ncbi:MAG: LON peptidase substrate-binding domain-containing protein, partial [Planctomycetales bacterium]|nr:LON peptidase substrate-binding domain-containing protein [Planctomycetales bacterium]
MADYTKPLPVLPLKTSVLFPHQMLPLVVGRPNSIAAVEAALATEDKTVAIFSQLQDETEDPRGEDLFTVGTLAVIRKMVRNDEMIQIVVQGIERVRWQEEVTATPYLTALVNPIPTPEDWDTNEEALHREILTIASQILSHINPQAQSALQQMIGQVESPIHQVYVLSSLISLKIEDEQRLLAAATQHEALELMHEFLVHELRVLEVRKKISEQAQSELSREQRDYVLRKQLRAIQAELGEENPEQADVAELRRRVEEADLPESIRKEVDRELARMERLPSAAPDYQITRSYLELVVELPWKRTTSDQLDLLHARDILDRDHFGLEKVKARIIEHLAVMKLNASARSPILCFVGPPGVGKTSLGKSIAAALGREFVRESLGGLSDEAELRGHRRTYIGAMPGRIIQAMRRAGVRNPVIMLDEIDKLGRDFRGDPAAALLEILDPAQNNKFRNNYLNLPFNLSQVFFIATAN